MTEQMTEQATIRLVFMTESEMPVTLNIRRAGLSLSNAIVDSAMDEIIASNAYDTIGRGALTDKVSAHLILTQQQIFDVAEVA